MPTATPSPIDFGPLNPMSDAALWTFWRALLEDLGVSLPLNPWILSQRLADYIGKDIDLEECSIPGAPGVGFGALIPFPDGYLIAYASDVSPSYKAYIVCHELTHIARGHPRNKEMLCGNFDEINREALQPGSGRYFSTWKEWEAETSAAILVELMHRRPLTDVEGSDLSESERLYARAIGGRAWRRSR
ncbi:ImmA/IrrE family metallo-endopeptidase [Pseudonocardia sp. ICBG601]|uniref:ImmA/IrrE family metallo-endopeptidase n=1 Tax=Pseudonocardia sp. ICBG601 TaxID=2846759 RepID=UPI001CF715D6|nr:ImmA/IrrE family metallo-endopeptidase [Pseudonocardia sp. ICBG601]